MIVAALTAIAVATLFVGLPTLAALAIAGDRAASITAAIFACLLFHSLLISDARDGDVTRVAAIVAAMAICALVMIVNVAHLQKKQD